MITVGSLSRDEASVKFSFLSENFSGRRKEIKEFTHLSPDYVFWVYPDGRLFDAKDAHQKNVPKGYRHILNDEPDYGGFLRGRVASNHGEQLIVVYCREEALAADPVKMEQFLEGVSRLPIPLQEGALVISDNGDIYGTIKDIEARMTEIGNGDR